MPDEGAGEPDVFFRVPAIRPDFPNALRQGDKALLAGLLSKDERPVYPIPDRKTRDTWTAAPLSSALLAVRGSAM